MPTERRLAAIMFTDIVGYTALMAESEEKGLRRRPAGAHGDSARAAWSGVKDPDSARTRLVPRQSLSRFECSPGLS